MRDHYGCYNRFEKYALGKKTQLKAGTMSKHLKYLYTFSEFVDIVEIKFDCFKACKKYNVGLIDIHKDIP